MGKKTRREVGRVGEGERRRKWVEIDELRGIVCEVEVEDLSLHNFLNYFQ